MTDQLISAIAAGALPMIFAITMHEAAHAYAAKYFGDTTAYAAGRMSMNPAVHIHPIGTIVLPLVMYFLTSGALLFGYAKPVPLNFAKLRNPRRDMALVALAGPLANLAMAFCWMAVIFIMRQSGWSESFVVTMAVFGVQINLFLMAFNLFPLPPLDGGRIVTGLLPLRLAIPYAKLEPYGFIILLMLIYSRVMNYWAFPIVSFAKMLISAPFLLFQ